jgi:hypothetical protein
MLKWKLYWGEGEGGGGEVTSVSRRWSAVSLCVYLYCHNHCLDPPVTYLRTRVVQTQNILCSFHSYWRRFHCLIAENRYSFVSIVLYTALTQKICVSGSVRKCVYVCKCRTCIFIVQNWLQNSKYSFVSIPRNTALPFRRNLYIT